METLFGKMLRKWSKRKQSKSRRSAVSCSPLQPSPPPSSKSSASVEADSSSVSCAPLDSVKVLVGRSKKPYVISSRFIDHPVIRVLIHSSDSPAHEKNQEVEVACEVVVFDHLLWMLQNGDNDDEEDCQQGESFSDLVELYACDC
eukprot:TRINITY_DN38043_c0_g1_i1.p1 TRINITY_DN38043_c0_g1~~TRINITY_DN38043_c0_g1_i1.p1  ORF type:complete len:145 (-),score=27.07 TRINITY_DN38043_c0_g1_i1:654-1088(-)